MLLIVIFRKKEGVQLNMALAETYYFNLKVCSDDANLDAAGIASCCGKTESQALITVEVTDENINAPNFDFYIGEDQVQNIPEGTLQEDDTGKSIVKLRTVFMQFNLTQLNQIQPHLDQFDQSQSLLIMVRARLS